MPTRSLLIPGLALATAGAVALSPALVAPAALSAVQPAATLPSVHIENIQLAGVGRDIYNSITSFVQYTVASAVYWVDLIPYIGPQIGDQITINYFAGIQPLVAATVYYASDLVANIFAFVPLTVTYASTIGYIGYNWASAQAQFFGFPGFPVIPPPTPLAATGPRSAASAVTARATAKPRSPRAAAAGARAAASAKSASARKAVKSARAAAVR